jgi:hypothetical protein
MNKSNNQLSGCFLVIWVGQFISSIGSGLTAFSPFLLNNGLLSSSIGKIIGTGQSRGIGLMFLISGILVIFIALILWKNKAIRALDI